MSRLKLGSAVLAVAVFLAACADSPISSNDAVRPADPTRAIFDAAHSGSVPGFYFLPPMVSNPSVAGSPDMTLAPSVAICALGSGQTECAATQPQGFPIEFPSAAEGIQLSSDAYQVNWHTSDFDLDENVFYRITIRVGSRTLGYADVDVVENGSQLRHVDTGEFIPLKDGRTLPIKFRIETGILGGLTLTPGASTLHPGETTVVGAAAVDLHGAPIGGVALAWLTEPAGILSLDVGTTVTDLNGASTAVATASSNLGQAIVQVTAQGLSATTQIAVTNPPPPASGLLAYWPFAGNAVDATGNGHDGTVDGATLTSDRFGRTDHAYEFDGADDRIAIGDYFGALPSMTISVWVRMNSECLALNKWCTFFSKTIEGANQQNFQKTFSLAKVPFAGTTNWFNFRVYGPAMFDAIDAFYAGPMEADRWYHVVATYDSQDVRLYLDGMLADVTPRIGDLHVNSTSVVIGAIASGGNVMDGTIDDVRVYDRALSQEEVLLLLGEVPNS